MKTWPLPIGALVFTTLFFAACFGDKLVAPDDLLPPDLAIDRPRVQLFRYARGRFVAADTVRITNNGEGPLGEVRQVGGVDYLTTARVGWLSTQVVNVGIDEALLILHPTYAEEAQEEDDLAEVVLKAEASSELRFITVTARTLQGASFEFSVTPLAFAAAPGDPPSSQRITVRNGGNGTLAIHPPEIEYEGGVTGWLSVVPAGGAQAAPEFDIKADPGPLGGGGLFSANLIFSTPEYEDTRAKPAVLEVQLSVGQPVLGVSASSLGFSVIRGAESPVPEGISISNAGAGPFEALGTLELGTVSYGPQADGWLQVSLEDPSLVEVSARTTGLLAGDYQAEFSIGSENGGSQVIQVELTVESPTLTPSSRKVSFGMVEGDGSPPSPVSIRITNTGSGTFASLGDITLSALEPSAPWLVASLANDEVTLAPTPAATALLEGEYTTTLPIESAFGETDTVEVVLSVSRGVDDPVLSLSATTLEFNGVRGDPPPSPQSVQISNSGGGSLGPVTVGTIAYAGEVGWLSTLLADSTLTFSVTTGSLPEGSHLASVPLTSLSGGNASVEVTFAVGSPVLTASAASVSFTAPLGGPVPPPQQILLSNTGPGSFGSLGSVTAGPPSDPSWLSASLVDQTLTLTVTTVPPVDGTYGSTVPVASAEGGSLSIEATFTVNRAPDSPDLVVSHSSVRMDAVLGGSDPPDQTVLLSNGGGGDLGALGVSEPATWLSTSPPGPAVTLSAETGSLSAGTYQTTVSFTSANGGDETLDVTLEVGEPVLTLSSEAVSFTAVDGEAASPSSILVTATNSGAGDFGSLGTVDLGAFGGGGWLAASLPGGGDTVTLTATPGGLGVGTYTRSVPVTSDLGRDSSIEVVLTITAKPEDPELVLSSTSVSYFAEEGGGNPAPQWVSVSNGGGGGFSALAPLVLGAVDYGGGPDDWLTPTVVGETIRLDVTTGLTPDGSHTGEFTVTPSGGVSETVSVTFTVEETLGAPNLELGATSVSLTAVFGGDDPPQRGVAVINSGSGSLGDIDVDVTAIAYGPGASGWLADTQHSDTEVTLIPRTGNLAPGTYTASVPVTSLDGGDEALFVTFTVESATLSLETRSVSVAASAGGGNPADQTVGIINSGAGDYDNLGSISVGIISYDPAVPPWLTATVGTGELNLQPATGTLNPGVYRATVPVSSTLGGSDLLTVSFTVRRSQDQPDLVVSPAEVRMDAVRGSSNPTEQTVLLSNGGGGVLGALDVVESSPWLSTSPPGTSITLSADVGTLTGGSYTTTVQFTSVNGGDELVDVTLFVAEPILTLSTQGLSFAGLVNGSAPPDQSVTLTNTGAGTLANLGDVTIGTITYGPGATNWVTSPPSASTVQGGTFVVGVTLAGLNPGSYAATVPVNSEHGGEQSVSVTLSVVRETDPPSLVLSTTNLRFGALVGGDDPNDQLVLVSNGGGGSLGTVQLGPPGYGGGATGWLDPSLSGDVITARAMSGGLAKGTYTATLPVVSTQGGTENIEVILVVGTPRLTVAPRTVSFGDTVAGLGPPPELVTIANTGGGTFSSLGEITLGEPWYGPGGSGWLATTLGGNSLSLTALTGALEARPEAYEALVPVVSVFGGADTVAVVFTVAPGASPPRLVLSVDSLAFDGIVGGGAPSPQTVSAFNGGGGSLGALGIREISYQGGSEGWLSFSADGLTLEFQPNPEGLTGGIHRALVVVESEHGGERSLGVRLNLAQPVLSLSTGSVTFSDTVGSSDTLSSKVFLSNTGGGDRQSLGALEVLAISYTEGSSGWLMTDPSPGATIAANLVELKASGEGLPEGSSVARMQIASQWGGIETVTVTFTTRKPDRSFDLPIIELVQEVTDGGTVEFVPIPGDSAVVATPSGATAQIGLQVGVRNGSETRITLAGLRVGVPAYPAGQSTGWITGAFLNRTTATFADPAELSIAISPQGLANGRYEASLVISSESAGLAEVEPRTFRVVLEVG